MRPGNFQQTVASAAFLRYTVSIRHPHAAERGEHMEQIIWGIAFLLAAVLLAIRRDAPVRA